MRSASGLSFLAFAFAATFGSVAAQSGTSCSVRTVYERPLRVGDRLVYVTGAVLSESDGKVLLAGFPNYVWPVEADRDPAADSIFGVMFDLAGHAQMIPLPIDGYVAHPTAIRRPDGGWRVVFAQVERPVWMGGVEHIVALYSGVLNGSRWSDLRRLPLPDEYSIPWSARGSLAMRGDTVAYATRIDPTDQIAFFERVGGHWFFDVVTADGGSQPSSVGTRWATLLPGTVGRFEIVALGSDVDVVGAHGSVYSYALESHWRKTKLVTGLAEPLSTEFSVSVSADTTVVVTWVSGDHLAAYRGSVDKPPLDSLPVPVSLSDAEGIASRQVVLPGSSVLLAIQGWQMGNATNVFLYRLDANVATFVAAVRPAFQAMEAVETVGHDMLLVGMKPSLVPKSARFWSQLSLAQIDCGGDSR